MARLDTRGFMDGALRGFDMADRHFARKDARDTRNQGLRMAQESHEANLSLREAQAKRAEEQHAYLYGEDGKGGALRDAADRSRRKEEAQIGAHQSRKNLSDYQLRQHQKAVFLTENAPLIQTGWQRWLQGGDADEIFDSKLIKGSAYDPRRYLDPAIVEAGEVLETRLPGILHGNGDLNDPALKQALGAFYQPNLDAVVGQTDPHTGKTIKAARWGGVTLANDIQPDVEGEQPGLVLTTEVNVGGDEWVPKPVTERRSTENDDFVKVIPLETAMQDITGQLALRRQAMASPAYQTLFERQGKDGRKQDSAMAKQYRDAYLALEKERSRALANQLAPTEESTHALNRQFDEQQARLRRLYGREGEQPQGATSPEQTSLADWVGDDANKAGFLRALEDRGEDIRQLPVAQLDAAYNDELAKLKARKEKAVAEQVRQKYISR